MTQMNSSEVLCSWGFRIAISPDAVDVARDNSCFDQGPRTKRFIMLVSGAALSLVFYIAEYLHAVGSRSFLAGWTLNSVRDWRIDLHLLVGISSFIWPMWPLALALRILYPVANDLKCNKDSIELTRVFRGKVRRVLKFPAVNVSSFRYDSGMLLFGGTAGALSFNVEDRTVKCLSGLRCVEAQMILNELRHRGFDVPNDPAMPAICQMRGNKAT